MVLSCTVAPYASTRREHTHELCNKIASYLLFREFVCRSSDYSLGWTSVGPNLSLAGQHGHRRQKKICSVAIGLRSVRLWKLWAGIR